MEVKAVLFDFGDTLVSFEDFDYEASLKALHKRLVKNGIAISYEKFRTTYFKVRDRLYKETDSSLKEIDFRVRVARVLDELGFKLSYDNAKIVSSVEAFMDSLKESLKLDRHVPRVLKRLKKKYKLGLVSNFAFPPTIREVLAEFGLCDFFDAVIVSGDVGWRKPSPKIFQRALKTLRVSASETVFVSDAPLHDIEGAKRLGMKTILLKRFSGREMTETGNPDKIINSLEELLLIL